jgi:hypothetical protein
MTSSATTPLFALGRQRIYLISVLSVLLLYNVVHIAFGIVAVLYGRPIDFTKVWSAAHLKARKGIAESIFRGTKYGIPEGVASS